jgi:hypothetical protein
VWRRGRGGAGNRTGSRNARVAYISQGGWYCDTVRDREAETCLEEESVNGSTSEKNCGTRLHRKRVATGEAPTSRTVCLTWPVVRVLSNHDDSDFAQRGIIRPRIDIPRYVPTTSSMRRSQDRDESSICTRGPEGDLRAGYTLRSCTLSSGPSTPSLQRNSFREIKYGFFISSLRIFSLNWSAKCPWPHGPPGD